MPPNEAGVEWLLELGLAEVEEYVRLLHATHKGLAYLSWLRAQIFANVRHAGRSGMSLDSVVSFAKEFKARTGSDHYWTTYCTAMKIIRDTLGLPWLERHIMGTTAPTDYFRNACETEEEKDFHAMRVIQFAEYFVNLRKVPGIRHIISELKTRGPEAVAAELETGALLLMSGLPFCFVVPAEGRTYDVEFLYGGLVVCGDTKCKIEENKPKEASLIGSMRTARGQLPKDKPGVIFVKVPQWWHEDHADFGYKFLKDATDKFFKQGTRRITCVYVYQNIVKKFAGINTSIVTFAAFPNDRHRWLGKNIDWKTDVMDPARPNNWTSLTALCAV